MPWLWFVLFSYQSKWIYIMYLLMQIEILTRSKRVLSVTWARKSWLYTDLLSDVLLFHKNQQWQRSAALDTIASNVLYSATLEDNAYAIYDLYDHPLAQQSPWGLEDSSLVITTLYPCQEWRKILKEMHFTFYILASIHFTFLCHRPCYLP